MDKIIKKVPGDIPPLPKTSNQGFIDDLSKKEKYELVDLLSRQNKLLSNKSLISKLPDKGVKIIDLKQKIELEIERRDEIEKTAQLLSRLNIAAEGKAAVSEMEWTGKYNPNESTQKVALLDSDDEEDPLKILAQPTGSGSHKKKIITLAPEESCIKPEDLEELESVKINEDNSSQSTKSSTDNQKIASLGTGENSTKTENAEFKSDEVNKPRNDLLEEKHLNYIVNKVENNKYREPFKPYKTTKSNVHDPNKEKQRVQKDVSAATPPPIAHNPAIIIDIKESLKLQQTQASKLQELEAKHATERLIEKLGMYKLGEVPEKLGSYRDKDDSSSSDDENYEEVHDEDDDKDLQGTVTYTVDSIES